MEPPLRIRVAGVGLSALLLPACFAESYTDGGAMAEPRQPTVRRVTIGASAEVMPNQYAAYHQMAQYPMARPVAPPPMPVPAPPVYLADAAPPQMTYGSDADVHNSWPPPKGRRLRPNPENYTVRNSQEPPLAAGAFKPAGSPAIADADNANADFVLTPAIPLPALGGVMPARAMMTPSPGLLESAPLLEPPVAPEELRLVKPPAGPEADNAVADSPILAALREYKNKAPDEARKHLAGLDRFNQEALSFLLPLAVRLSEGGPRQTDPQEIAGVVDQLQGLIDKLRCKAALRIDKLCYCRPVPQPARYGVYLPLDEAQPFRQGELLELYMELRNFSCEARDKKYTVHLSVTIEIRDERGTVVEPMKFERDKPDVGHTPRQDYFHICRFPVPGIAPGTYTLVARVTDVPTGRSAERALPLRVAPVRAVARSQ